MNHESIFELFKINLFNNKLNVDSSFKYSLVNSIKIKLKILKIFQSHKIIVLFINK
jgi:hypothetical protein